MTTFCSQRQDPAVARAEERLLEILHGLGTRIPELEVGEFYQQLSADPPSQPGKLAAVEDGIGVRLCLRLIDQVVMEYFAKIEESQNAERELASKMEQISLEARQSRLQIQQLQETVKSLNKTLIEKDKTIKDQSEKNKTLTEKHKILSEKFQVQTAEFNELNADLQFDKKVEPARSSQSLPVGGKPPPTRPSAGLQVPRSSKKRKSPDPEPVSSATTSLQTGKRRPGAGERSGQERFDAAVKYCSTQAGAAVVEEEEDPWFVPDTASLTSAAALARPRPGGVVPDTQDPACPARLGQTREVVTPQKNKFLVSLQQPARSPVLSSKTGQVRLLDRQPGQPVVSRFPLPEQDKPEQSSLQQMKNSLLKSKKIPKVAPSSSKQSAIDKKAYKDLDQDFPYVAKPKPAAPPPPLPLSDTDSDFESPNLLRRAKRQTRTAIVSHAIEKKKLKPKPVEIHDLEDEIYPVASPLEQPEQKSEPQSKSKSVKGISQVKGTNKFGLEKQKRSELSDSNKKREEFIKLQNKQVKLDSMLGRTPSKAEDDFVRVSHADTDIERAIKLSMEVKPGKDTRRNLAQDLEAEKEEQLTMQMKHQESRRKPLLEDDDYAGLRNENGERAGPSYAHVGPAVRGREQRAKLLGFDCPECADYYRLKLDEGLSKEQILLILNKCSRHRGYFKPPLTPEKFWDPEIIEGDPDDPRNKTQAGSPIRSRVAERRARREAREARNVDKENR